MSGSFIQELKRRNVFRVAVIYVIVGWLLMQVGDVMFPALLLPEWSATMLAAFLILGLPVALILAWAYEITPEGLKRTEDVEPGESITHVTGRKIDFMIIGVLAIAVIFLVRKVWFEEDVTPVASVSVPDKSIAVLPFDNRSASEENAEFFAAGVHDDLLTLLSNLGDLKVISRTSVERLDPKLSILEIGSLLGVATVLEGQVQRAGDQLRINAQLIDTATENHLWAKTYDRELTATNVFAVQSDIAKTIAEALHAQLSPGDQLRLANVPTQNTRAYELYLLGMQQHDRGNFAALRQADAYFHQAAELDPNYAEAWVGVAAATTQLFLTGAIGEKELKDKAVPAIERALELNDQLPEAHVQRAKYSWQSGDHETAEREFEIVLSLTPNNARALKEFGIYLRVQGRVLEAVPILERARELDPLSTEILFQLGKVLMHTGRPEQALPLHERIREIDPASVYGYVGPVQVYVWMGRYDLLYPWGVKASEADPADYESWAGACQTFLSLGATDWAARAVEKALSVGPGEPAPLATKALQHVYHGENAAALETAQKALDADLFNRWGSDEVFLRIIRDASFETGEMNTAINWYRQRFPGLFQDSPKVDATNINNAANLVLLLQKAGDTERAETLLDTALNYYQTTQPPGVHGYDLNIVDTELFALKGEKEKALAALRQAVEGGWRSNWWWYVGGENLASLHGDPEFQALVAEIEADMTTQLEAIRQIPNQGEYDLRFAASD
ncbi:MAG: tetratricopeptide repeat protein [Gammaproteobacteria bacterium]